MQMHKGWHISLTKRFTSLLKMESIVRKNKLENNKAILIYKKNNARMFGVQGSTSFQCSYGNTIHHVQRWSCFTALRALITCFLSLEHTSFQENDRKIFLSFSLLSANKGGFRCTSQGANCFHIVYCSYVLWEAHASIFTVCSSQPSSVILCLPEYFEQGCTGSFLQVWHLPCNWQVLLPSSLFRLHLSHSQIR